MLNRHLISKTSLIALLLLANISHHLVVASSRNSDAPSLPQPAERIRNEPESVWVEFVQLAQEFKPLNLGQGFPDFAAPKYLIDSLVNATNQQDQKSILTHQYTRPFGHPRLIKALQAYYSTYRHFSQLQDAKQQVLVTVGAYEALFTALMAFVSPGDEVLIIDPAFDAYAPIVAMAQGSSVYVPLRLLRESGSRGKHSGTPPSSISSSKYRLDMEEFEAKITNRTRVLVLNTPNNPLGKIFSLAELEQIAHLCKKHNLLVVADEVYEQFYYSQPGHLSIAQLPGMWERTITIGSAGKTFSVTGWKIGWALGPKELIKYLQLVHQTAIYTVATPLQEAVARQFEFEMQQLASSSLAGANGGGYWHELRAELEKKRDQMARLLIRANFRPIVPEGGYFMLADYQSYLPSLGSTNHTTTTTSTTSAGDLDFKFARWLAKERGLLGIPGRAFYHPLAYDSDATNTTKSEETKSTFGRHLIRFCFIKKWETFDELEKLIDAGKLQATPQR